jgi:hypothetical protein
MGVALHPSPSPLSENVRVEALTRVEPRSPQPAFKNLGRGVF